MINIFGKLYTFLRRPPSPTGESSAEGLNYGDGNPDSGTPDNHESQGASNHGDASNKMEKESQVLPSSPGSDVDRGHIGSGTDLGLKSTKPVLEKVMNDSTASGDWEHIQDSNVAIINPNTEVDHNDQNIIIHSTDVNDANKNNSAVDMDSATVTPRDEPSAEEPQIQLSNEPDKLSSNEPKESFSNESVKPSSNESEKFSSNKPENPSEGLKNISNDSEMSSVKDGQKLAAEKDGGEKSAAEKDGGEKSAAERDGEEKSAAERDAEEKSAQAQSGGDTEAKKKSPDGHRNKEHDQDKKEWKDKTCKYFQKGLKCWRKDKCKFAHIREGAPRAVSSDDSPPQHQSTEPKQQSTNAPVEGDYPSYLEYVCAMTLHSSQINPKDLLYKLGYLKGVDTNIVGDAVIGQYKLARNRQHWFWIDKARYFAGLFFDPMWIDENLPKKNQKQRGQRQKKTKENKNDRYEVGGGLCQDFRLKENPNIEKIVTTAGGDGAEKAPPLPSPIGQSKGAGEPIPSVGASQPVADSLDTFTEQVIQQAMQMAISEGLSESLIMEVIDDVTAQTNSTATPLKPRFQPTKVDLSRTPRSRPDQLAIGFNYHSDVVVKESPRTVGGQIIVLDNLRQPREQQEQLAIGFSFHADQLVKDSPRTEKGEVLIPGVVTTPRRKTRDQLAVGFGYHSNLIAKDTDVVEADKENNGIENNMSASKNKAFEKQAGKSDESDMVMKEHNQSCIEEQKVKSKKLFQDTFAIGFSHGSSQILKQSLDGNIDSEFVTGLIEDAVKDEGRNMSEMATEETVPIETDGSAIVPTGLPAGSVW
ncbi:uncharacterized protein LOC128239307 [Mya arenaria]|uniref:uncharacterized protein LOC128239307 n=1 Tax=Mya arenaria TaxID=6604 RepID=UPI0022E8173C|nr:uncharacterized protein LOC128239307 [Mya arenaria]